MAKCIRCGKDTYLYDNGTPYCVGCATTKDREALLKAQAEGVAAKRQSSQQIEQDLTSASAAPPEPGF